MIIKKLAFEDLLKVCSLLHKAKKDHLAVQHNSLENNLTIEKQFLRDVFPLSNQKNYRYVGIQDRNKLIGFASFQIYKNNYIRESLTSGNVAELTNNYIDPRYRGQNLQRLLIQRRLDMIEKPCSVYAVIHKENSASIKNVSKEGFAHFESFSQLKSDSYVKYLF